MPTATDEIDVAKGEMTATATATIATTNATSAVSYTHLTLPTKA